MKLQAKLLVLYLLTTGLIMVILGIVLYSRLWEDRLLSIQADISSQFQHIDFALDSFFTEVKNDVNELAANDLVRTRDDRDFTSFLNADERTFVYRIGETEQKIIGIFNNYRSTHPYVSSVYMGRENGGSVRSHKRARPTRYDPRERPWYILAKNSPETATMTPAYPALTTPDINIGVVSALVDEKGEFYGVVGADVTLMNLTSYVSNFKTNPPGAIILLDRNNRVMAGLSEEMLFKNIKDYSSDLADKLSDTRHALIPVQVQGSEAYVYSRNAIAYDWKIVVMIPSRNIKEQIESQILITIIGLALGLLLLSFLTYMGLARYVVRPLTTFIEGTRYIAETSDLERRIDISSADEIGSLAHSYNRMLDTLNRTYLSLKDTESDLIRHRDHLEELVNERTASLQEANEKLSVEIAERVRTLDELALAKERAEAADKIKSAFLATMSHELRTPLNSIIGFTGMILQGLAGPLNEEQTKQMGMVRSSARHLLALINDILDISKIEAGQLSISSGAFNLKGSIEKVAQMVLPLAEKKGLKLRCRIGDEIDTILGDQRRMEQVIMNLLSNAVKFTDQGDIDLKCHADNDVIILSVTDTGMGIKPEDMEVIFSPFHQVDIGITRVQEGTGLGLTITRKLVEMMGGAIRAESEWGKGSTFTVSLPQSKGGIS